MTEEAIQKTRWLGRRQRAIVAIELALSEFLPRHPWTPAERDLVHDIRSLTRNVHLNETELRTLERLVADIKLIIAERTNSS